MNDEGYKCSEGYSANPYSVVISKIIDMSQNDSELNRELIIKIAKVIASFEKDLVNDKGIWYSEKHLCWIYQTHKGKRIHRANSLESIRKKKIDYLKKLI